MNAEQISQVVDSWIGEDELPVSAGLKQVRRYDLYTGMDESEIEAYWDFISWYLGQEHLVLLSLPEPEETGFLGVDFDEFGNDESAFNTHDYQRLHPFDKYHWMLKKMCERVKDLAITHSCIRDEADRDKVKERFLNLVRSECKEKMKLFFKIWREYAYWE